MANSIHRDYEFNRASREILKFELALGNTREFLGALSSSFRSSSDCSVPSSDDLIQRAVLGDPIPSLSVENLQKQIIGFEVFELIGEGGMGQVFRAHQESLSRNVAIKVLRGGHLFGESDESIQRFRQEAKTMARLQHPIIVTVFDF